jgi:hypothetical protein
MLYFIAIIVLAKLFQVRHQDNEAREYAKKALQFNPRCPEALKILRKLNLEDEMDLSEFNVCLKRFIYYSNNNIIFNYMF